MNKITDTDDKVDENISATDKMGSLLPRPPAAPSSPLPLGPSDLGSPPSAPRNARTRLTQHPITPDNSARRLASHGYLPSESGVRQVATPSPPPVPGCCMSDGLVQTAGSTLYIHLPSAAHPSFYPGPWVSDSVVSPERNEEERETCNYFSKNNAVSKPRGYYFTLNPGASLPPTSDVEVYR